MTPAIPDTRPADPGDGATADLSAAFRTAARDHPEAAALQLGRRIYSYAEADDTARRWAAALTDAAGQRPRRVGVFAYRSPVSYLGALAALYAGASVVPLDRTSPHELTRTMIESARPDVLLADSASALQLPRIAAEIHIPLVAPLADASLPLEVTARQRVLRRADIPANGAEPASGDDRDPAYMFFDGACGLPPYPIAFSHAALGAFLRSVREQYAFGPEDRFAQVFDQSCDLSLFDLFAAWQAGACVVPLKPLHVLDPVRFADRQRITVWFSSPAVAEFARQRGLLTPGCLPGLRWSFLGGAAVSEQVATAWQEAAVESAVECWYGPPGLPVAGAVHRWDPRVSPGMCARGLAPIGRPFPGVRMAVLDDGGRELSDEQTGELCFAGPGAGTRARASEWRRTGMSARRTPTGEYVRALAPGDGAGAATQRALVGVAAG
ncbi:MAG TPA: AMP-binding protein [Actinocrinis sp.]|nr:AMP-binding protein [Actinocrinis sp.]